MAASMLFTFKSAIFFSAISLICALVTFPTLVLLGCPEPLVIPAAFLNKSEAGGVFNLNS